MTEANDKPDQPNDEDWSNPPEPAKPAEPAEPAEPAPEPGEESTPVEIPVAVPVGTPPVTQPQQPPVPNGGIPAPQPPTPYGGSSPQQTPAPYVASPQQPPAPYGGAPAQSSTPPAPQPPSPYGEQPPAPYGAQQTSPYGTQPPSPYGGYASQPIAPAAPSSGKAVAALICGIGAIVFSGTVFVGIILGVIAIVLASQYVRAFGRDGKATGGKVCGILGIVFSILMLVVYLLCGAALVMAFDEYETATNSYSYNDTSDSSASASTEDEAAALVAAVEALNLADNQQVVAMVAEKADDYFQDSTDQTLAEAGFDATEFAQWLMDGKKIDMTADDLFVYSNGTGEVYAEVTCRTMYGFMGIVYDDMDAYIADGGQIANEAEYLAKVSEFSHAAMDKAPTDEAFISLNLVKKGDTWTVDEDSLEEAVQQMFGLW